MQIYLAVTDPAVTEEQAENLVGPWVEVRRLAGGALLVESDDTLSRVHHELKWSLPDGSALLVAPIDRAKLKGQPAGTQTWLRDRSVSP